MNSVKLQSTSNSQTSMPTLFDTFAVTQLTNSSLKNNSSNLNFADSYQTNVDVALKSIFPDRQEENKLQKARKILGDEVTGVSDEELGVYIAEFQFLLDSWLDEYEIQVFDGKTLKQLTKEGQNGTFYSR